MLKLLNSNNVSNFEIYSINTGKLKKFSNQMSNNKIDKLFDKIKKNKNVTGGKLIGAGGGGFFSFNSNKKKLIKV